MNYGFVKVAAGITKVSVANTKKNAYNIIDIIKEAYSKNVQILVCPELCITAYTCQDLFFQHKLISDAKESLKHILEETCDLDIVSILGMPVYYKNKLYNCAVVIQSGKILGIVPKTYLPNYGEFLEKRWFYSGKDLKNTTIQMFGSCVPFGVDLIFVDSKNPNLSFGVEICEDLWAPISPSSYLCMEGAKIIFNLSASNDLVSKGDRRRSLVKEQSNKCLSGYVYVSSGVGESTTDLVFGGHAIIAESGVILKESERFLDENQLVISDIDILKLTDKRIKLTSFLPNNGGATFRQIDFCVRDVKLELLDRHIERFPFVPQNTQKLNEVCNEVFSIQKMGLAKRLKHTGIDKVVVGVSGGLDSTLALLVVTKVFDYLKIPRKNILAVTMPGFGTTDGTKNNAKILIQSLEVSEINVDIREACERHFRDIGHDGNKYDVTYENVQARERTQILMDIANKNNALVVGTGDLSELALGFCTYNGDHMSMYGVNSGVPKTLVKCLINWEMNNEENDDLKMVLKKIIDLPISPELLPPNGNDISQKTEDIIGKYDLHDFFLYHFLKYGASPSKIYFLAKIAFSNVDQEVIKKTLKIFLDRFFSQQFKRSCMPDSVKVGKISLSPRSDLKMPSDAENDMWLEDF